jgi:small subunit ribosomal protein S19e
MTTVYDVPAEALIMKLAEELESNQSVAPPSWAIFVKTGVHNQRPPEQSNWWYIRAGSVLRRIYIEGPVGVMRMRTYYGGKKNRGHKPEKKMPGGGAIIRTILHQLQEAGYVESTPKGRVISAKGASFLDNISNTVKDAVAESVPELSIY